MEHTYRAEARKLNTRVVWVLFSKYDSKEYRNNVLSPHVDNLGLSVWQWRWQCGTLIELHPSVVSSS
jgi:hypothetical protein